MTEFTLQQAGIRVIHVCRKCRHAETREWDRYTRSYSAYRGMGDYLSGSYEWYVPAGTTDDLAHAGSRYPYLRCPQPSCAGYPYGMRTNVVVGRRTDATCGPSCLRAKTAVCECSCEGRNHGGRFALQQEELAA